VAILDFNDDPQLVSLREGVISFNGASRPAAPAQRRRKEAASSTTACLNYATSA
jgi:hypothetical protein